MHRHRVDANFSSVTKMFEQSLIKAQQKKICHSGNLSEPAMAQIEKDEANKAAAGQVFGQILLLVGSGCLITGRLRMRTVAHILQQNHQNDQRPHELGQCESPHGLAEGQFSQNPQHNNDQQVGHGPHAIDGGGNNQPPPGQQIVGKNFKAQN